MSSYATFCYAKINLFLTVGPKDEEGYHPLRTVFQTVGLADKLTVQFRQDRDHIQCNWEDLPAENTLTKTLRLARELVEIPPVQISLAKEIPAESGLGGGSSNAAGLLRILSHRFSPGLNSQAQYEIASSVGCDVPFFLVGGTARGAGRGEVISALPDLGRRWVVIVKPDLGVSSKAGYAALDQQCFEFRDFPVDSMTLHNDFERVMPCACGDAIERLLSHGAEAAHLTGSGSAVFAVVPSEAEAHRISEAVAQEGLGRTFAVPFVNREQAMHLEVSD